MAGASEPAPLRAGDVVELKSGSFPMTVESINPAQKEGDPANCFLRWNLNGEFSGRAQRLAWVCLPIHVLKIYQRPEIGGDDLPF